MGKNIFWKSILRRKAILIILILFVGVASFGFALRTIQYLSIHQEIQRISQNYRAIGSLENDNLDVTAGAKLIEKNPYVAFTDERRYYSGIMSNIYNADIDSPWGYVGNGLHTDDVIVYGQLKGKRFEEKNTQPDITGGQYNYQFEVKECLFGYPEHVSVGKMITVIVPVYQLENKEEFDNALQIGETYLLKGTYALYENKEKGGSGNRFYLKQIQEGCWILNIEEAGNMRDAILTDKENLLQEMNRHAMAVFTTKDMSSLPEVQEALKNYYLTAGRWLNADDQAEARQVCVVRNGFAAARNLHVGDTIVLTIRDDPYSIFGYVTGSEQGEEEEWSKVDSVEVKLEIVGIYGTSYSGTTTHYNILYVPDSCVPADFSKEKCISQGAYSFVLTSPKVKDEFINEMAGELKEYGITISFVDDNWDAFYEASSQIERSALADFIIFSIVMILELVIVVFVYRWQRKKEFAISRALGVPAGRAAWWCMEPMLVISLWGIMIGTALSWNYALKEAAKALEDISDGEVMRISLLWLPAIGIVVWIVFMLILASGVIVMAHRPVLESLQGVNVRKKEKIKTDTAVRKAVENAKTEKGMRNERYYQKISVSHERQKGNPKHTFVAEVRFVLRSLYRSIWRSSLVVFAAIFLLMALGAIQQEIRNSEEEVDRLYRTIAVEADIIKADSVFISGKGFIRKKTVQSVIESGYIDHYYLEALMTAKMAGVEQKEGAESNIPRTDVEVYGVQDAEIYMREKEIEIQYADGYDNTVFQQVDRDISDMKIPVFLSETAMFSLEADPGDAIILSNSSGTEKIDGIIAGFYSILGSSSMEATTVIAPLSAVEELGGNTVLYTKARFWIDTSKNRELEYFRNKIEEIVSKQGAGVLDLDYLIWDSELRLVVEPMEKNIQLMEVLYPVTLAVAVLIALGLSILLITQRTRETAILRVLGNTKRGTALMLMAEQFILTLLGLLIGIILSTILFGSEVLHAAVLPAAGLYLLGALTGTMAGVAWVGGKKPLELLQVKE